jgi:hypothetical protein
MFRYTFGITENDFGNGGCVLAFTEKQAIKKVKAFYKAQYIAKYPDFDIEKEQINVWLHDEFPLDLVEVY